MQPERIISSPCDFNLPPWERGVRQKGPMNKEVVKSNALIFKKVMDRYEIKVVLTYGTLLGAIRDKDVISSDSDFDVFCFPQDYLKWLEAKKALKVEGFSIPDYKPLNDEYLIKDGEKIDINWMVKFGKFYVYDDNIYYPTHYFDNLGDVELFGVKWLVPADSEKLLEELYGPTWRIPSSGKGNWNIYSK